MELDTFTHHKEGYKVHKKPTCTGEAIEDACLRLLDSVLCLEGVRVKYGVETAYEPKEKFRVHVITVSEKVE
jgi:hypothetical protein